MVSIRRAEFSDLQ